MPPLPPSLGATVASSSWDKTVRLWSASTGESLRTLEGHTSGVTSVAFSADGRTVASGSFDATLRLWDSSDPSGAALRVLRGHSDGVTSVSFSVMGTCIFV